MYIGISAIVGLVVESHNVGMLYAVGTHIDLSQKKEAPEAKQESNLYVPGTTVLFVKFVEGMTRLKIAPTTIAYIQPTSV